MLKSYGWGGGVGWGGGPWDFSVSPRPLGFGFWIWGFRGFGAKGLRPGLDNLVMILSVCFLGLCVSGI